MIAILTERDSIVDETVLRLVRQAAGRQMIPSNDTYKTGCKGKA